MIQWYLFDMTILATWNGIAILICMRIVCAMCVCRLVDDTNIHTHMVSTVHISNGIISNPVNRSTSYHAARTKYIYSFVCLFVRICVLYKYIIYLRSGNSCKYWSVDKIWLKWFVRVRVWAAPNNNEWRKGRERETKGKYRCNQHMCAWAYILTKR